MRSLIQKAITLLFLVTILGACTGVRVSQDYDSRTALDRFETWHWEEPEQPVSGDLRVDNPLLNKRIRRAIETHLADRNIEMQPSRPDLAIAYRLVIQPKLENHSYHSSLGGGGCCYPWSWGGYPDTYIYQYDECQIIIDIKDAVTQTLLWRGTGIYRYQTYKSPDTAAQAMQRTVDRILAQFPPQTH